MSDLFEREQQHNFFQSGLPERPENYRHYTPPASVSRLPETPEEYTSRPNPPTRGEAAAGLFERWNEDNQQRGEFKEGISSGLGAGLSMRERGFLYDMRERGFIDDNEIYRIVSSRELAEYLELDPAIIYNNYDEFWQIVSNDRENRYALPQSRAQAIHNSIQIAKNMEPLGRMGIELQNLHNSFYTANESDRAAIQRQADSLWKEIRALQRANEELSRGMPTDALSTIITSTIQSAPFTGKSMLGGIAGGLVVGGIGAAIGTAAGGVGAGPGFAGGWKVGYSLGAFAASSSEMTGLMYVDLLAAGVEQENAARLALIGGGLNGLIESQLGIVGGWGKSLGKAIGGRALSQAARNRIAEAASKSFIKRIMSSGVAVSVGRNLVVRTAAEMGKQALGEGIEEGLQNLVEQGMLAWADAMQDAPVERNAFMSPEYKNELWKSMLSGFAAGIGFGITGMPFTITGNVSETARQTEQLQNLAVTIDNKTEFRTAARENPLTRNLSDEQIDQLHDSQEGVRQDIRARREREETARAEELRNRRLYGAMDKSGDTYRNEDGGLHMEVERHTESGGLVTFEFAAGNPHGGEQNSYAIGKGEMRGDVPVINELRIGEKYEGLQDEILQNLANDLGKEFSYGEQRYAPNGEGQSLRFGWGTEQAPSAWRSFDFNKPNYNKPDSQADTAAKQNFVRQLRSLDTRLQGDAAANTVVDFYDTVGRKWFGMGFDAFINRLTGGKPGGLLTQELSDAEIARWVAHNEGTVTDAAAVQRIQENLTDAQREEARQNIRGFATPGANGVTKAIYAARDADMSTFIHEGVHAFTQLAKALDPALYRQMIEAAGFSQEEYNRADAAGRENMMRQAMETLAYGAEAYLKEGPKGVRNSVLHDLYERIKEFLKDLADAAQKAKYLTPEVQALFDGLFGEQGQEGSGTAAESGQESANEQQETNVDTSAEELEIYSDSFDRIIKDESRPIKERSKAAVQKAGREYSDALLDKRDQGHRPTMELIKRATRITDTTERTRAIAEIRELRKRYAGTMAEYKAPNGKKSLLLSALGEERGREAWYAVRMENFKKLFGDWELAARIEAIEKLDAEKVNINNSISQKEAENIARLFEPIKNSNDGRIAEIPVNTIGKIIKHKGFDISRIIENIPALYKTSKLGWSETEIQREGHKTHTNIKAYHHYINKFTDGTNEYFIRIIVNEERTNSGKTRKNNIHSTAVSDVNSYKNKTATGSIVSVIIGTGEANSAPPFIDTRLAKFFNSVKGNISKIVDENGEPLIVHRGDQAGKDRFTNRQGVYFAADKAVAEEYASGGLYDVFLDIKNPLDLNEKTFSEIRGRINDMLEDFYELDWSELEHNEQFQALRENYLAFRNEEGSAIRNFYNEFLPEVSEDTPLEDLKEILIKSVHDANTFEWRQIDYKDIDILNPFIKTLGYDGITRPYDPLGQSRGREYVTFEPNQIKSATDNAGTFDPNNPSILFQTAYHASPYWFDSFNNSHVGSGLGNLHHGWGHYLYGQKEAAEWFKQTRSQYMGVEGQLYEVDIPGDNELLQWDKKISEQAEVVQKAADRLISWDKNGNSNFDKRFNLRQFDNGFYGFSAPINGKMKWPTIKLAKDAARVEIINTFTGKEFYNTLSNNIGEKKASLLLNHLGIKGTKYFDKNVEKIGVPSSYNYVIYGDSELNIINKNITQTSEADNDSDQARLIFNFDDNAVIPLTQTLYQTVYHGSPHIEITQTFYSEAFRDTEFNEFMNSYPEVVKEAARFNSGAEMAEHYADWLQMPDEVYKKARALGYFDALARAAKTGDAESATNVITGVSAKKAVDALAAYGVEARYAHEAAEMVRNGNWQGAVGLLEQHGVPRIDAETYADTAKAFSRSEILWLEKQAETTTAPNADDSTKQKKLGVENQAVQKFFDTLVDSAKEIFPDEDIEAQRAELAGEPRTAKAFVDMIYTDKGFDDLIKAAYEVIRDGSQRGMDEAETQRNETLFNRIRTAFNPEGNWNWKTAFAAVAVNRNVDARTKKILQGMIRNRPLQYMEAWAMLTGDDTWLPDENDVQRIRRLDTEGLVDEEYLEKQSPEEIERIGRRLSSDRVKKKIDDKTLLLDDPDLNDYEKQLKEDMARASALIAEREEGFKDYRRMLDLAERNARKEQMLLEQKATDTSDEGLKKSREQTKKTAEAHKQVQNTIAEMERFMREDLTPTQRAAFLELRQQLKEKERINAELKAIAEIREIKKRNLRQILRKPDLKTVSVNEARLIEWVQAHFDSYEAVARFIGRGAKDIRKLYNEFATSPEYREKLKKKLPPMAYHQIERIVFKDLAGREVRAYGEIDARQRRALYKHLIDYQGIFEELGIDILAEPRKFNEAEWSAIRNEMKDRIPADVLSKLEGLIIEDQNGNRRFRVENLKDSDLQTLAGVVNKLRKEGREREAARKDARTQLWQEGQEKILETLKAHLPKNAAGVRMAGIAATKLEEQRKAGKLSVWHALHNARRFFRMLEGGKDGYLHDYITQREYDAFDEENRHVFERREKVEKELKEVGIDIKDLGRSRFTLWNGQEAALDEMLTFHYAMNNERALHAVMFGNFASQEERNLLERLYNEKDIEGSLALEAEIAKRYWDDIKKLDVFFAQGENAKFRQIMNIIGRDYDDNYGRLKEFAAREFNEELGSEPYYMPLSRISVAAKENNDFEQAMADAGHSPYIGRGFTKSRVDIPSFGQQPIQAGFYAAWDRMVTKQEHLMAYGSLHREMKQIFQGQGSEMLRETLKRGHSDSAVKYIEMFISELAAPPVQEDLAAMNTINRIIRGHFPAAVLGWRAASIVKQAIESPPPFFQYVNPIEYAAAGAACLRQETRDMISEKSVYMKSRYFDPAMAVVREMEKLNLAGKLGKAEAKLAKIESIGMKGQSWIDSICVMPGWLAAYNKKLTELNKSDTGITIEEAEAAAVRYADGVVRDCQPSSVLMDQTQLLKGDKGAFARMFMQFQTPIASIFQQLFMDTPANFRQGRILQGLWTWGIYALLAIVIGAMHEDDDDDELDPKKRGIDALVMPFSMVPVFGGDLSYAMETLLRDGKIRMPRRSYFPVLDQMMRTGNAISDEKWGKAAWEAIKGFGYYSGLPVGTAQDIEKVIETGRPQRLFGIR